MDINKKTLSEQTADKILKLINQKYSADDQIPNEMELAKQLNVSRTTVREAIKLLCAINAVEIRRGKGTFVCGNPGMIKDPFGYRFFDKHKLVSELYEMCILFEPEIAALAAKKAKPEALKGLKAASEKIYSSIQAYKNGSIGIIQLIQSESDFHAKIANCCDNSMMTRFVPLIVDGLLEIYYWNAPLLTQFLTEYHDELVCAICSGDSEKAREYMRRHLLKAKECIV